MKGFQAIQDIAIFFLARHTGSLELDLALLFHLFGRGLSVSDRAAVAMPESLMKSSLKKGF
jgi:hypothetical protein